MREIGDIDNELDANTFRDFLFNRGVEAEVERNDRQTWSVWVEDENRLDEAGHLLAEFKADPSSPTFVNGSEGANARREKQALDLEAFARKQRNRDDVFGASMAGLSTVTYVLIALSIMATLLTQNDNGQRWWLMLIISTSPDALTEVSRGEVWRLVTPIFVHGGIVHILFNMLWLMDLGRMIEARRGSWFFLLFVVAVAVLSNAAQFFMSGPAFGGMSGVVYAMLGYVWMQSRFNPWSGFVLHSMTVQMMLVWFVICLVGLVGNIANTTHTVGLVSGVAWGYLEARRTTR